MSAALDRIDTGRQNHRRIRNHNSQQRRRQYDTYNNQNYTGSFSEKQNSPTFLFIGNIGGLGACLALFALAAAIRLLNAPLQSYNEEYIPDPYIPEQDPKIIEINPEDITVT